MQSLLHWEFSSKHSTAHTVQKILPSKVSWIGKEKMMSNEAIFFVILTALFYLLVIKVFIKENTSMVLCWEDMKKSHSRINITIRQVFWPIFFLLNWITVLICLCIVGVEKLKNIYKNNTRHKHNLSQSSKNALICGAFCFLNFLLQILHKILC